MRLLSIGRALVKATAKFFAYPEQYVPFISAAGRPGRAAPSMCDIIDTRQKHGGSHARGGRLSAEPEPFSTELLGYGRCSRALSIDDQTDHESKRCRNEDQPGSQPT